MSKNSRVKSMLMKQAKENTPDIWEQIDQKLEGRPVPQTVPKRPVHSPKLRYAVAGIALVFVAAASVTMWKVIPLHSVVVSSAAQPSASQTSGSATVSSFDSSPVPYSSLRFASLPDTASSLDNAQGYGAASIVAFTEKLVLSQASLICKATILNAYVKEYKYDTYSDKFETRGLLHDGSVSIVYEIKIDDIYYNNAGMHTGDIIKVENELLGMNTSYTLKQNHQYILPLVDIGETIMCFGDYASGDITRDGRYGLSYQYAPQIEITLDGQYVFHSGWESLINDKTVNVIWDNKLSGQQHYDYYTGKMKLRQDADFINDFKALIAKYKG